jgi:hypothetical protein
MIEFKIDDNGFSVMNRVNQNALHLKQLTSLLQNILYMYSFGFSSSSSGVNLNRFRGSK